MILTDIIFTGYVCKKALQMFDCKCCKNALTTQESYPVSQCVDLKSKGKLIHANLKFFDLINKVEKCFAKHVTSPNVFDLTMDEILSTYNFTFPCKEHASDIT